MELDEMERIESRYIDDNGQVKNIVDEMLSFLPSGAVKPVGMTTPNSTDLIPGQYTDSKGGLRLLFKIIESSMRGGIQAVPAATADINGYAPSSGRFIDENGQTRNIIDELLNLLPAGSVQPVNDLIVDINKYHPHSGRYVAEDGKAYNIVDIWDKLKMGISVPDSVLNWGKVWDAMIAWARFNFIDFDEPLC